MTNKGRVERRAPHKSEIKKRGKGNQAMKRMGKRLAVLTVAVCLFVSTGVANKSFGQILWVASVDAQMGVLPVYAEPTANSAMVGSLQRCTRVILTGLEKDSFVEISQPIAGWAPANLLGEYSCSQGSVAAVEPTVVEPTVVESTGVAYGPYFTTATTGITGGITIGITPGITLGIILAGIIQGITLGIIQGIIPDILLAGILPAGMLLADIVGVVNLGSWIAHMTRQGWLRPPFAFISTGPLILIILMLDQNCGETARYLLGILGRFRQIAALIAADRLVGKIARLSFLDNSCQQSVMKT